jgi:hypothetical protein
MEEVDKIEADFGEEEGVCCDAELIVLRSSEKKVENKEKNPAQHSDPNAKEERDKRLREELRALEYLRNCCLENNSGPGTSLDAESESSSTRSSLSESCSPQLHPSERLQGNSPAHKENSPQHEAATTSPGSSPPQRPPPILKSPVTARKQPAAARDAVAQSFGRSLDFNAMNKWLSMRHMPKLLTALKTSICESLLDPTVAYRPCPDRNPLTVDDFTMTKKVAMDQNIVLLWPKKMMNRV